MAAEVKKLRPDIDSSPEMILGMLNGYSKQIKHIAAVVVWDDGSYQLVHDAMKESKLAYALALFQKELFEEI